MGLIRLLLPPAARTGRPRADDRRTIEGVLYILTTGCRWQDLPREYGAPTTVWRRLKRWGEEGVWERIWRAALVALDRQGQLDWSMAFLDGSFAPAKKGGDNVGLTKKGKGTKWMLVVDGNGLPLGFHLDSANVAEVRLAEETLDTIRVSRGGTRGRPKQRPKTLVADRGYDSSAFRGVLRRRGIRMCIPAKRRPASWRPKRGRPVLARREEYRLRYKVERSFAWLGNFRRLLIRWERTFAVYRSFFEVALVRFCLRRLFPGRTLMLCRLDVCRWRNTLVATTDTERAGLRRANHATAQLLHHLATLARPGVTTSDLNDYAMDYISQLGAIPVFATEEGFPGCINTSVNDVAVHGVPGKQQLKLGDVLSIDAGMLLDGYAGDATITIAIGKIAPKHQLLIETAREAMMAGIQAAQPGQRIGDIGYAIQSVAWSRGFDVVREYIGHGLGHAMHEPPAVPSVGRPGTGPVIPEGLVMTIEPILVEKVARMQVDPDGWSVRTRDGGWAAQFEHTIIVTPHGADILSVL